MLFVLDFNVILYNSFLVERRCGGLFNHLFPL